MVGVAGVEAATHRPETPVVAGFQAGRGGAGSAGGSNSTTLVSTPTGVLVAQLGALLRRLIEAGAVALPLRVRLDLATLLAHATNAES